MRDQLGQYIAPLLRVVTRRRLDCFGAFTTVLQILDEVTADVQLYVSCLAVLCHEGLQIFETISLLQTCLCFKMRLLARQCVMLRRQDLRVVTIIGRSCLSLQLLTL